MICNCSRVHLFFGIYLLHKKNSQYIFRGGVFVANWTSLLTPESFCNAGFSKHVPTRGQGRRVVLLIIVITEEKLTNVAHHENGDLLIERFVDSTYSKQI